MSDEKRPGVVSPEMIDAAAEVLVFTEEQMRAALGAVVAPLWRDLAEAREALRHAQEIIGATTRTVDQEVRLLDHIAEVLDAPPPPPKPATQEVPHQPLQPIDDKVEAFRKKFFERTGDRLQRTAVVEGLRAALGGEALVPVGEEIDAAAIRAQARAIRDHLATVDFDNEGLPPVGEIAGALVVYAATQCQSEDERESTEEGK